MPTRLMTVLPTLLCGGTEKQAMTLTWSLQRSGYDVECACLRRCGPFVGELEARGIPLTEYCVPSFWSARAVEQQAKFAWHLRRTRTQIVHSYNFYGNVFAVPAARVAGRSIMVVASIRDCGPYLTPLQRRAQRYACRLADAILVNAAAVKDWLVADGYDPAKIAVIHNGVDLQRFRQRPDPEWLHTQLGVAPASPLVGVVSRIVRQKGLDDFLQAARIVAQRFPLARFLVVGEANPSQQSYVGELEALARRLGIRESVIFTGLRTDVPEILSSLAVSVMPSRNEALSNSLLESMAAGAPVVATSVGGIPEALADGAHGLLVPPADPGALAGAITALLQNRERALRLGAAARAAVTQRFSIERMVEATERLYVDLLARKHRAVACLPERQADRGAGVCVNTR